MTDIPSTTWAIYRAPGLPVVGLLGGAFGFVDANLRAAALLLNLGALTMAWALTRLLWGPLAAIVALLTIVGSPVVIAEIALFHTDLPAAGLLLTLMLLVWYEFERRPEPSRLLIAAAPLAAFAFYLRYGSILPIAGIGITAVLLWHRSMLRNKGLVGLTVALAALLFAPHILELISHTGIASRDHHERRRAGRHVGAGRHRGSIPRDGCQRMLAHRLGFVVMLAGIAHEAITAIDTVRRRELGPDRPSLSLAVRPRLGHDGRSHPAVAPGGALRPVPRHARDHRRRRGHLRRGCLAQGPSGGRRTARHPRQGVCRRPHPDRRHRGIGRGAADRRARARG